MAVVPAEQVLVVPTSVFRDLGYFQGFCDQVERYRGTLLDPSHTVYRPRDAMEGDPSFKQLIPYVIFRWRSPEGDRVFQYTRGKGQGESRLHRLKSIGVGGHICSNDASDCRAYDQGMRRELDEELIIETKFSSRCVGLINDDQNEVGRVHLGIVHVCEVERPAIRAREVDLLDAGFFPIEELQRDIDQFETWSQICIGALFAKRERI